MCSGVVSCVDPRPPIAARLSAGHSSLSQLRAPHPSSFIACAAIQIVIAAHSMRQSSWQAQLQMKQQHHHHEGRSATPIGSQSSAAGVDPSQHSSQSSTSRVSLARPQQRRENERNPHVALLVPGIVVKAEERQVAAAALEQAESVEVTAAAATTALATRAAPPPVLAQSLAIGSTSVAQLQSSAKAEVQADNGVEGACAAEVAQSAHQQRVDEQMWRDAVAHQSTLKRMQGDAQKTMDRDELLREETHLRGALTIVKYLSETLFSQDAKLNEIKRACAEADAAERDKEAQRELSRQQHAAEYAAIKRKINEQEILLHPDSPEQVLAASGVASVDEIRELLGAMGAAVQADCGSQSRDQQGGSAADHGSRRSGTRAASASNRREGRGAKETEEQKVEQTTAPVAAASKVSTRKR